MSKDDFVNGISFEPGTVFVFRNGQLDEICGTKIGANPVAPDPTFIPTVRSLWLSGRAIELADAIRRYSIHDLRNNIDELRKYGYELYKTLNEIGDIERGE